MVVIPHLLSRVSILAFPLAFGTEKGEDIILLWPFNLYDSFLLLPGSFVCSLMEIYIGKMRSLGTETQC